MPYDEKLDQRIRAVVNDWPNTEAKNMFGGVCHLMNGNMLGGVYKEFLILRLGPKTAAAALAENGALPFDITGRPMKGWVMMPPAVIEDNAALTAWLEKARAFVKTLPGK